MNEFNFPRGIPVMLASRIILTTGFGRDKEHKNARDHASDPAGVADLTLIAGTSALPAGIQIINRDEFDAAVTYGQEVIAIHGYCESNVPGQIINSTLSVILPCDGQGKGSVAELFEWPGLDPDVAIRRTELMAIKLYAERNGHKGFNPRSVWDWGKTTYILAGRHVYIYTIQAGGIVSDDGEWACAFAGAVLL